MFIWNKKVRRLSWWWLLVGVLVGVMVVLFGIGWKRVKSKAHVQGEEEVPQRAEATASAEENQG